MIRNFRVIVIRCTNYTRTFVGLKSQLNPTLFMTIHFLKKIDGRQIRSYYQVQMGVSQNSKLFAPAQVYTPSLILTYPAETAKFVMSDNFFSAPPSSF